jgi:hypothetical protein
MGFFLPVVLNCNPQTHKPKTMEAFMDYELFKIIIPLVSVFITVILWLATARENKEKATISSIDRIEENLEKTINSVSDRVSLLERDIAKVPSHEDIVRIHERIDSMDKSQSQTNLLLGDLSGQIKQQTDQIGHRFNQMADTQKQVVDIVIKLIDANNKK